MLKQEKTIELSKATYQEVAEFLKEPIFFAQNPFTSMRRIENDATFNDWRDNTLEGYPNSSIVITAGTEWFNQVRITDPVFQEEREQYSKGVFAALCN